MNLAVTGLRVVSESVSMMPHRPYPVELSNEPKLGSVPVDFPTLRPQKTPFFAQRNLSYIKNEEDLYTRRKFSSPVSVNHKLQIVLP